MKPDSRKLLAKSERSIKVAEAILSGGDADFAASRAYYAMFYCAEALLHEDGVSSGKHSGVHALFGERFAKPGRLDKKFHRWLLEAFSRRIEGDYGFEAEISDREAAELIEHAREFLAAVNQFPKTKPDGPCRLSQLWRRSITELSILE